jgi:hypothetical protein
VGLAELAKEVMNAIFIHIPRTAGRSIKESVRGFGDISAGIVGHATIYQMRELRPQRMGAANFIFTVVRNPWDWRHSWYHWLRNAKPGDAGHPYAQRLCKTVPFRDHFRFVHDLAPCGFFTRTRYGKTANSLFTMRQSDFIDDSVKVVHFENLEPEMRELFGQDFTMKAHIGKSHSIPDYRESYDEESRDIVSILWKKDIEKFGYEF